MGHEPAPEGSGGDDADDPGGQGSSKALALAQLERAPAVETAEGGGCGVAPAEEQNAHDCNVLGEETQNGVCAQQVPDHAVVARHFCFPHERANAANVELIKSLRAEADNVCRGDGDERGKQPWGDLVSLDASAIQMEGKKADGDMEELARYLVTMDEVAITSVEGDQAQRRG